MEDPVLWISRRAVLSPAALSATHSKDVPQPPLLKAGVVCSKEVAQFRSTLALDYVVFKHLKKYQHSSLNLVFVSWV